MSFFDFLGVFYVCVELHFVRDANIAAQQQLVEDLQTDALGQHIRTQALLDDL